MRNTDSDGLTRFVTGEEGLVERRHLDEERGQTVENHRALSDSEDTEQQQRHDPPTDGSVSDMETDGEGAASIISTSSAFSQTRLLLSLNLSFLLSLRIFFSFRNSRIDSSESSKYISSQTGRSPSITNSNMPRFHIFEYNF